MLRTIIWALLLIAVITGIIWLSNHPGEMVVTWLGYEVTAPILLVVLVSVAAVFALTLLITTIARLFDIPVNFRFKKQAKQHKQGLDELTLAITSLATADTSSAARHTKKAEKLLGNTPLIELLHAQVAHKQGDKAATSTHLHQMLEHKPTGFLAARALSKLALNEGDETAAISYAEKAQSLQPQNDWSNQALYSLYLRTKRWQEAERLVTQAKYRKALSKKAADQRMAALYVARAQDLIADNQPSKALPLLGAAHKMAPEFVTATLMLAQHHAQAGNLNKALGILARGWKAKPHPALADMTLQLTEQEPSKKRSKRVKTLTKSAPKHIETQIAIARIAYHIEDMETARIHAKFAVEISEEARICRLLADIEQKSGHDKLATEWLTKASMAKPDPAWHCTACSHRGGTWHAVCPECTATDSVCWGSHNEPHSATESKDSLLLLGAA